MEQVNISTARTARTARTLRLGRLCMYVTESQPDVNPASMIANDVCNFLVSYPAVLSVVTQRCVTTLRTAALRRLVIS